MNDKLENYSKEELISVLRITLGEGSEREECFLGLLQTQRQIGAKALKAARMLFGCDRERGAE